MQSQKRPGLVESSAGTEKKLLVGWKGTQLWGQEVKLGSGRELCCSKKESRVSCRGFCWSKSGMASNLHAFVPAPGKALNVVDW